MCGFEALWVPGTDHAGICYSNCCRTPSDQNSGKKRKDFAREEFLEHVWEWKEEKQSSIIKQLKRLGCSCDWSRLRFTMDEEQQSRRQDDVQEAV